MFFWLLALVLRLSRCLMRYSKPPGPGAVNHAFHLLAVGVSSLSRSVRCGVVSRPRCSFRQSRCRPTEAALHVPVLEGDGCRGAATGAKVPLRAVGQLHRGNRAAGAAAVAERCARRQRASGQRPGAERGAVVEFMAWSRRWVRNAGRACQRVTIEGRGLGRDESARA